MFKKIKGGISSDEGFSLRVLGRAGLEYKEGNKVMLIDSEMLGDPKIGFAVASSSINRWKGSKKKLERNDCLRILNNVKEALKFEGYEIRVIEKF